MAVNRWTPSYSAVAEAPTSKKGAAAEVVDVPDDTIPRFRKGVKQVATLGPKTFNKEMIEKNQLLIWEEFSRRRGSAAGPTPAGPPQKTQRVTPGE